MISKESVKKSVLLFWQCCCILYGIITAYIIVEAILLVFVTSLFAMGAFSQTSAISILDKIWYSLGLMLIFWTPFSGFLLGLEIITHYFPFDWGDV